MVVGVLKFSDGRVMRDVLCRMDMRRRAMGVSERQFVESTSLNRICGIGWKRFAVGRRMRGAFHVD